jgi:hypothetical protein
VPVGQTDHTFVVEIPSDSWQCFAERLARRVQRHPESMFLKCMSLLLPLACLGIGCQSTDSSTPDSGAAVQLPDGSDDLLGMSMADGPGSDADGGNGGCPAPNIWRYEAAGCGAEAHAVCGPAFGDACAAQACACDGETLIGCDFYTKPWRQRGMCPGDCFSPTHDVTAAQTNETTLKGCACDPATDQPQCVPASGGQYGRFSCVDHAWHVEFADTCKS